MKKLLIGTTALVAAGFVTSDAAAAEKIKLSLGGYFDQFVGFADNDYDSDFTTGSGQTSTGFDVQQDSEVHFNAKTKLDNGITVAVRMELETADSTSGNVTNNVDETYMTISSPTMGKVILGGTDTADAKMGHNRAPNAGAKFNVENGDTTKWIANAGVSADYSSSFRGANNDQQMISYISPAFSGLTVGGSYIPDITDEAAAGQSTTADDAWVVAANYKGKFNDVSVGADVFYGAVNGGDGYTGQAPSGYDVTGGGLKIGFGAFTVKGGYKSVDQKKIAGTTSNDGETWSVGGEFKSGPAKVALSWMRSERERAVSTVANDEVNVIALHSSYDLGGGISVAGSVVKAEFDDELTTKTLNNEGWAAVAAVQVKF